MTPFTRSTTPSDKMRHTFRAVVDVPEAVGIDVPPDDDDDAVVRRVCRDTWDGPGTPVQEAVVPGSPSGPPNGDATADYILYGGPESGAARTCAHQRPALRAALRSAVPAEIPQPTSPEEFMALVAQLVQVVEESVAQETQWIAPTERRRVPSENVRLWNRGPDRRANMSGTRVGPVDPRSKQRTMPPSVLSGRLHALTDHMGPRVTYGAAAHSNQHTKEDVARSVWQPLAPP